MVLIASYNLYLSLYLKTELQKLQQLLSGCNVSQFGIMSQAFDFHEIRYFIFVLIKPLLMLTRTKAKHFH